MAEEEEAQRLHKRLEAAHDRLGDRLVQLLFDLSFYHARERRPAWWGIFDRAAHATEELIDDLECLAGLVAIGAPAKVRQSWERSYRFPEQETKLVAPVRPMVAIEDGVREAALVELDRRRGRALMRFYKQRIRRCAGSS